MQPSLSLTFRLLTKACLAFVFLFGFFIYHSTTVSAAYTVTVNGVSILEKIKVTLNDGLSVADATTVLAREVGYGLFGAERYSKGRKCQSL